MHMGGRGSSAARPQCKPCAPGFFKSITSKIVTCTAQSALVHFIVHTVDLGAHQLSHGAATVVAVPVGVLEHGTHAAQRGQVHFVAHGLDL